MLNYFLSFFKRQPEDLSLEESCDILQDETTSYKELIVETSNDAAKSLESATRKCLIENSFAVKSGIITSKKNSDIFIIDGLYEFDAESKDYTIGTKVSYTKYVSDGKINVYNVNIETNDWDHENVIEKETIWSDRVIIRKVEKREKRILILTPNNISVDLDKVSVEFIPLVGDWLELDVKCEVDENAIDLSGEIIGINKISPVRPHIEKGTISTWDHLEGSGTINRNIFFNKDSLSCGYIPVVGDKIISEVIESEQRQCVWRALKVIPEFATKKLSGTNNSVEIKIEENHPGLQISDITSLSFNKLNGKKAFVICLRNVSNNEIFELVSVEFARSNHQCILLDKFVTTEIGPQSTFSINCECVAKNAGKSSEYLILTFKDFTIGKWVNIEVCLSSRNQANTLYQRKTNTYNRNNLKESENQIIRGQRKNNVPRFAVAQLPWYPVPQKLLDLVTNYTYAETARLMDELKMVKPVLFSNLGPINYEERFHTLLHLDEITNLIHIRTYDQDRACFIPNQQYLMLEIENLSEKRPSIVLGDKIIATDPLGLSNEDYEGNVHKVGAKHVYLQFSAMFHETYNGEDYSIKVVPGRAMYRRLHHAVFNVARNLGKDILFPTKILEKEIQVKFTYETYSNTVHIIDSAVKKVMSPKEIYKKMMEFKENAARESGPPLDGNVGDMKLEWYNKRLNCKQKDAVINILKGVARPLPYIIFGPPGTGKTVTVIETILQTVRLIPASRLLVTAPSNSAADLLALRLIDSGVLKPGDLVRLVSVNYAVGENIPAKLIPYCATASVAIEGTSDENVTAANGMTLDCSRSVMGRHKITVSTCSSSGYLYQMGFPRGHFTHIIVDEAGQAAEPEVMIPISLLDKYTGQVVLAGDPMQLGPVVLCKVALECGLGESLLERLINRFPYVRDPEGFPDSEGYDPRLVTKLLYNYRSLSVILHLFSSLFYDQELIPTISDVTSREANVRNSLGEILPKTIDNKIPSIVFHGVNGENYQTADSPSWYNPHEAAQVFYYVNEFYRLGLTADSLGVITPYTKQVKEIRSLLRDAEFELPKVGTVEDFQGQEYDVIILSTVRSRQEYVSSDVEHSLGFVASPRRLNVAISRPKVLLIIVGNPNLLCNDIYWRNVIKYCVEKGGYCGCDLEFL